jgi:succinate dehydrogenase hydrophobic anchor subunit
MMSTEPVPAAPSDAPAARPSSPRSRSWRWTSLTGVSLLVLVTAHMVAQHFVLEQTGGLRTYQQVLEYISNPIMFVIESLFLVVVTWHAMLGLRSVLFDFGLSAVTRRRVSRGLTVLGVATVAYGFVLIGTLASRA